MVRLTLDMLQKRAEHNEGVLSTLQEVSLHQENIERIELIDRVCPDLRTVLLQSNLIGRIENLNRLKRLEVLNLAINNIERIEGLHRCEKLRKLDLLLNFVDIDALEESLAHLKQLEFLRQLSLQGNPCATFPCYRGSVILLLPLLEELDGKPVTRTERINATRERDEVLRCLRTCAAKRSKERESTQEEIDLTKHSPEARLHSYHEQCRREKEQQEQKRARNRNFEQPGNAIMKTKLKLAEMVDVDSLDEDVLPSQRNTGRYKFSIEVDKQNEQVCVIIDVPRFMASEDIKVQVQTRWFQLQFMQRTSLLLHIPDGLEVAVSKAEARRIQATGAMELCLPISNFESIKKQQETEGIHVDEKVLARPSHIGKRRRSDRYREELSLVRSDNDGLSDSLPPLEGCY
ncbi:MAG: hypothetical protein MHM6MM_000871 [Cercozoa sp. M6MM]